MHSLNPFAMYGVVDRLNLILGVPFLQWHQVAHHQDNHHRTETVAGLGDINIGARWLIVNQSFGPGQRFFVGLNVTLPTGESYAVNPFSEEADSIAHRHFAPGDGLISSSLYFEWWYRSEFPLVLGVSGRYSFPWTESNLGFLLGKKASLTFHVIRQRPLVRGLFPYLKLVIRREEPDSWEGARAGNSGGRTIEGLVGIDLEVSERISAVFSYTSPIWRKLNGSQLDPGTFAISFRRAWK